MLSLKDIKTLNSLENQSSHSLYPLYKKIKAVQPLLAKSKEDFAKIASVNLLHALNLSVFTQQENVEFNELGQSFVFTQEEIIENFPEYDISNKEDQLALMIKMITHHKMIDINNHLSDLCIKAFEKEAKRQPILIKLYQHFLDMDTDNLPEEIDKTFILKMLDNGELFPYKLNKITLQDLLTDNFSEEYNNEFEEEFAMVKFIEKMYVNSVYAFLSSVFLSNLK